MTKRFDDATEGLRDRPTEITDEMIAAGSDELAFWLDGGVAAGSELWKSQVVSAVYSTMDAVRAL